MDRDQACLSVEYHYGVAGRVTRPAPIDNSTRTGVVPVTIYEAWQTAQIRFLVPVADRAWRLTTPILERPLRAWRWGNRPD